MSNNVQILNYNHNVISLSNGNTIIITDNVKGNSISIPQPVTNILQINSPGPQGPQGPSGSAGSGGNINTGSFVTTSSFNAFTASYNTFTGSYNTGSFTGSFTGSLLGTASFATTSSHALNGGVTSIVAGTGISRSSATGSVTITNTAPDQTVSLTNGGNINITGTYPSFTLTNSAPYPGPGYQQLLYIFSQVGGSDPTFNGDPIINTTEATFTFKRNGAGEYELKADSPATPFTLNRTAVYLTPGYTVNTFSSGDEFLVWFEIVNRSTINIYSYNIGVTSLRDDIFANATLDIKIYDA